MEKLMHDLYRGMYDPHERMHVVNAAYDREYHQWSTLDEQLQDLLPEECREKYKQFSDKTEQLLSLRSEDDFIAGFQLGARLMLVAVGNDSVMLK